MENKKYEINCIYVEVRVIEQLFNDGSGNTFTKNVVDYCGKQYDVIANGGGDMWIEIDDKRRYLQEP